MLIDRARATLQSLAFVLTVAAISTVGSERIFWFWSPDVVDHTIVVTHYAIPTFLTLLLADRYRLTGWRALALALPIYAYLTEGLLTPIIYSGGPFIPVFPAWFTAWHGIFSLGLLVFGLRWLILHGGAVRTTAVSVVIGLFWGVWSATLRLPENVNDQDLIDDQGGPLHVLDRAEFAEYAISFTVILVLGHWLLGWLWPRCYEPSQPAVVAAIAITVLGVTAWSFAIPWALPMFTTYAGIQIWAMRRSVEHRSGPSIIESLHGRVPARRLAPLLVIAPTAAMAYAVTWQIDSFATLRVLMWGTIAAQTVFGAGVIVWALWGARDPAGDRLDEHPTPPAQPNQVIG